jgi:hypothetical protein
VGLHVGDDAGPADQAGGGGSPPPDPPSIPVRKRKWDWRTDSRNEPIGIVGLSRISEEDASKDLALPVEGAPEVEDDDEITVDELVAGAAAPGSIPHAELFAPDRDRGPRPRQGERRRREPTRSRRLTGLLGIVVLLAVAATLYATLGAGHKSSPPANSHTATPSTTHATTPTATSVNPKVVSLYRSLAKVMGAANILLHAQLTNTGAPTLAEAAADITPYTTDVKNYEYELHYLAWPRSMNGAVQSLYVAIQDYNEYLDTFSSVDSDTLASWLTGLDHRGQSLQKADNRVRHDLGLTASHLFP